MNRYYMIRRLRMPVFLLLLGTMAIVAQMGVFPWHRSWPLILIYFGVMLLIERAVLVMDGYPNAAPAMNAAPGAFAGNTAATTAQTSATESGNAAGRGESISTGPKGVQL